MNKRYTGMLLTVLAALICVSAGFLIRGRQMDGTACPPPVSATLESDAGVGSTPQRATTQGNIVETRPPTASPVPAQALHNIEKDVTHQDFQAIAEFMRTVEPPQCMSATTMHSVKDGIMAQLEGLPEFHPGVINLFVELYQDAGQDQVIRDYAIQHLRPLYGRLVEMRLGNKAPSNMVARYAGKIQDTLWSAVEETGNSIGGTALLALRELAGQYEEIDEELVKDRAVSLALDEATGLLARVTALRLCGAMRATEILPVARKVASDDRAPLSLRAAAIGTLGDIAGREIDPVLDTLLLDDELGPLASAIQEAKVRISARHGGGSNQKEATL